MDIQLLIAQLEDKRERLNQAIAALTDGRSHGRGRKATNGKRGPRRLSAAARRKISQAQKKRWAKQKKNS